MEATLVYVVSELWDSLGYIVRPCLKRPKNRKERIKQGLPHTVSKPRCRTGTPVTTEAAHF